MWGEFVPKTEKTEDSKEIQHEDFHNSNYLLLIIKIKNKEGCEWTKHIKKDRREKCIENKSEIDHKEDLVIDGRAGRKSTFDWWRRWGSEEWR